jgi:Phage capsid protein
MATSVPSLYVRSFERTINQLAQQSNNRLRPWCQEVYNQSSAHSWENLAAKTAQVKVKGQRSPTFVGGTTGIGGDAVFTRRVSVPLTMDVSDYVEPEDIVQVLTDPLSALAENHAMAIRRAQDKEIITRAIGTALNGAGGNDAAPAGNQLAGAYATEINFDLVTEVMERFNASDVDPEEPKCFVIGPKQARKLLQLTEANSSDFVTMKPLAEKGYVSNWMGFTWILSNYLNVPAASQLDCFAMTKKAMGFQVARDIWSKAEEDPSSSYDYAVYTASTFGAVRVQDKHLVWVKVADTVA